jgi:hypothetical protein
MSKCNIIVTENFYKQFVAEALMNLSEEREKRKPKTGKCNLGWVREMGKNRSVGLVAISQLICTVNPINNSKSERPKASREKI